MVLFWCSNCAIQVSKGVFTTLGTKGLEDIKTSSREGLGCTKLHVLSLSRACAQTCYAIRWLQLTKTLMLRCRACRNIKRGLKLLSWLGNQSHPPDTFLALHSTGTVHRAQAEWKRLPESINTVSDITMYVIHNPWLPSLFSQHDHVSLVLWQHCFALTWWTCMTESSEVLQ